jgi:hypothetical protein
MWSSQDKQPEGPKTRPLGGRPGFGQRIKRGWRETDACWALISADPGLLILPVVSVVFLGLTWLGLYLAAAALVGEFYLRMFLVGVFAAFPSNFAGTFFGVAFVALADGRLQGDRTTVRQGLSIAAGKTASIAKWALVASGVGLVLQLLQYVKADSIASIAFAWIAGAAWGVLTFFVVPVIAFEERGARDTLRRSAQIVRERWGEGLGGVTNLGAAFLLVMIVVGAAGGILAGVVGLAVGPGAEIVVLAVVGLAFAGAVAVLGTGTRLLSLALYRVATGAPVVGFDQQLLEETLIPKRSRWRPWRR